MHVKTGYLLIYLLFLHIKWQKNPAFMCLSATAPKLARNKGSYCYCNWTETAPTQCFQSFWTQNKPVLWVTQLFTAKRHINLTHIQQNNRHFKRTAIKSKHVQTFSKEIHSFIREREREKPTTTPSDASHPPFIQDHKLTVCWVHNIWAFLINMNLPMNFLTFPKLL